MKLLFVTDLAHTGFGRVGRELATRFIRAGVDLRIVGINYRPKQYEVLALLGRNATSQEVKDRLDEFDADPLAAVTLPASAANQMDGMGHQLATAAIRGGVDAPGWTKWRPDAALILADPRAMAERLAYHSGSLFEVPTWNYVPIEGVEQPPILRGLWERVEPVAMSDFGREQLELLLGRPVAVAYHGVSEAFHEITPEHPGSYKGREIKTKEEAKAAFGWRGRTVLLRTDRLVPRKNYPALFEALGPLFEKHPEVLLVIHCTPDDEGGSLAEMLSRVPGSFAVEGSYQHPNIRLTRAHDTFRGMSDDHLNVLYNAADVYVSPTMAEGFGLCLAEAAACAVPIVTTNYAAGPEVVGTGALTAKVATLMTNVYAHRWALVDVDDFRTKVEQLITDPVKRRKIGQAGKRHVAKYTWDAAAQTFLELFEAQEQLAKAA